MSKQAAVYSCPSCGALSKVDPAEGDGSVCGECGYEFRRSVKVAPRQSSTGATRRFVQRDVVSRRRQVEREKTILPPEREKALAEIDTIEEEPSGGHEDEVVSDDGHKKVIRRRKRKRRQATMRPWVMSAVWIMVVIAVFMFLKDRMGTSDGPVVPEISQEERVRRARMAEMQAYIDGNIGECRKLLREFWAAPNEVGAKAQFVYRQSEMTPSMYRYSQQHGFLVPQGGASLVGTNLVAVDDLRAIETVWKDEDGQRFEVVFVRDEGKWKIDWEAYVRYSSTRWDVFVSGAIRAEGDFRLYMREKRLSQLDGGVHIGLKFYPPHYEVRSRRKGESPTVLVRADSALGKEVRRILDKLGEEHELGQPALHQADPKDMARVRVVLEWQQNLEGDQFLYLKEIKSGSWHAESVAEKLEAAGQEDSEPGDAEPAGEPAAEELDGDG